VRTTQPEERKEIVVDYRDRELPAQDTPGIRVVESSPSRVVPFRGEKREAGVEGNTESSFRVFEANGKNKRTGNEKEMG